MDQPKRHGDTISGHGGKRFRRRRRCRYPRGPIGPFARIRAEHGPLAPKLTAVSVQTCMSLKPLSAQYLHVIVGFILAYYVGYIKLWRFHFDLLLLLPIVESVVQLEKLYPRIKAMVSFVC